MKKIYLTASLIFILIFVLMSVALAQSPQQTLTQYIADLQKNPNDNILRERIIKHVQTMRPAPAIPEEARKRLDRGMAAAESAKNENDYKDAIEEFQKAVTIAPWLGIAYRNLAIVQDKAGQYPQALQNLRLFLLTSPPAADAEAAKTLMNKIEYRQEKAAKESSPQAMAAKEENKAEEYFKRIKGAKYTKHLDLGSWAETKSVDIYSNRIDLGSTTTRISDRREVPRNTPPVGAYQVQWPCPITNKKMQGNDLVIEVGGNNCWGVQSYTVSDDGATVTVHGVLFENSVYRRSR